jgi:hypothetical protein
MYLVMAVSIMSLNAVFAGFDWGFESFLCYHKNYKALLEGRDFKPKFLIIIIKYSI